MGPGQATITDVRAALDGLVATAEKITERAIRSYTSPPTRPPAGHHGRRPVRDRASLRKRYEAHLPAKEAQASPRSRVPLAHELTRGQVDAEAPPRQGAQATLDLSLMVA